MSKKSKLISAINIILSILLSALSFVFYFKFNLEWYWITIICILDVIFAVYLVVYASFLFMKPGNLWNGFAILGLYLLAFNMVGFTFIDEKLIIWNYMLEIFYYSIFAMPVFYLSIPIFMLLA